MALEGVRTVWKMSKKQAGRVVDRMKSSLSVRRVGGAPRQASDAVKEGS